MSMVDNVSNICIELLVSEHTTKAKWHSGVLEWMEEEFLRSELEAGNDWINISEHLIAHSDERVV